MPVSRNAMLQQENKAKYRDVILGGQISTELLSQLIRTPEKCKSLVSVFKEIKREMYSENEETRLIEKQKIESKLVEIFFNLNFQAQRYFFSSQGFCNDNYWQKVCEKYFPIFFREATNTESLKQQYFSDLGKLPFADIEDFSDEIAEKEFLSKIFTTQPDHPVLAKEAQDYKTPTSAFEQMLYQNEKKENPAKIAESILTKGKISQTSLNSIFERDVKNNRFFASITHYLKYKYVQLVFSQLPEVNQETITRNFMNFFALLQENKQNKLIRKLSESFGSFLLNYEKDEKIKAYLPENKELFQKIIEELRLKPVNKKVINENFGFAERTIRGAISELKNKTPVIEETQYKEVVDTFYKELKYNKDIRNKLEQGDEDMTKQIVISFFNALNLQEESANFKEVEYVVTDDNGEERVSFALEHPALSKYVEAFAGLSVNVSEEGENAMFLQIAQCINEEKRKGAINRISTSGRSQQISLFLMIPAVKAWIQKVDDNRKEQIKKSFLNAFTGKFVKF